MIRYLVTAAVLIVSGCASYSEMQAKEPRLEFVTMRSASAFAGCVMPRARDLWGSMVTIAPDGDSQVISIATEAATMSTTTITPDGSGASVAFRSISGMGRWRNEWPAILRACQ